MFGRSLRSNMKNADGSAYGHEIWKTPPNPLLVNDQELHIWRVHLSFSEADIKHFRSILSADEIERADRFIRSIHGERFTIARGALRIILGRYLDFNPVDIQFEYNEHGKPLLQLPDSVERLSFNSTHSGEQAVIAVCRHSSVGVDIEGYRESLELEKVAQRYFSPAEVEAFNRMEESNRQVAFYRCWSSKEAFMKATGQGLSVGLNNFEVEMDPARKPAVIKTNDSLPSADTWECMEIPMGGMMAGVVAVEGKIEKINLIDFEL